MVKISKAVVKTKAEGKGFIDIGKYSHYCYAESSNGGTLEVFEFKNNKAGFEQVASAIHQFKEELELEKIEIGLESTGTYGESLIEYLQREGIKVVLINPKHLKRSKELIDNSPGKSDKKDPKVGVHLMWHNKQMSILRPQGIAAELRIGIGHRNQLKVQENRLLNQLESHVVRIFPEFMVEMKGLQSKTAAYLLEHYCLPENIVELGVEELAKVLKKQSYGRLGMERALALYEAAKSSIGLQEGKGAICLAIKDLCETLELTRKQIKREEKALKASLAKHEEADVLESIPGVGTITAAEIIGDTGGLNNFKNAHQLEKLAGLNLYSLSSGTKQGSHRISKRGRGSFRKILYLAALRLVKKNGIFRAHYQNHLDNGMKKVQALIAVAKKLLRTMFSLVKNEEKFDLSKVA